MWIMAFAPVGLDNAPWSTGDTVRGMFIVAFLVGCAYIYYRYSKH